MVLSQCDVSAFTKEKYLNTSFITEDNTWKLNLERLFHLTILNEEMQSKPQSHDF